MGQTFQLPKPPGAAVLLCGPAVACNLLRQTRALRCQTSPPPGAGMMPAPDPPPQPVCSRTEVEKECRGEAGGRGPRQTGQAPQSSDPAPLLGDTPHHCQAVWPGDAAVRAGASVWPRAHCLSDGRPPQCGRPCPSDKGAPCTSTPSLHTGDHVRSPVQPRVAATAQRGRHALVPLPPPNTCPLRRVMMWRGPRRKR